MRHVTLLIMLVVPLLFTPPAAGDTSDYVSTYNAVPPAFGASTTVPSSTPMRMVFGSMTLSPSAVSAANVTISLCSGTVLSNFNDPPISGNTATWSYSFMVAGGDCYKFNNNLDPNGANRISSYNYVERALPRPTGARITGLVKPTGHVFIAWDPNSTQPDALYAQLGAGSPIGPLYGGTALLSDVTAPCVGDLQVWRQAAGGAQSQHETIKYDCDNEIGTNANETITAVRVDYSNATTLHFTWDANVTTGSFEIRSKSPDPSTPDAWFSDYLVSTLTPSGSNVREYNWTDVGNVDRYVRMVWYAENATGESLSCEVFSPYTDAYGPNIGHVEECTMRATPTLVPADDDSQFVTWTDANSTYVNDTYLNDTLTSYCTISACSTAGTLGLVTDARLWWDRAGGFVGATIDPSHTPSDGYAELNITTPTSVYRRTIGPTEISTGIQLPTSSGEIQCPGNATIHYVSSSLGQGPESSLGTYDCGTSRAPEEDGNDIISGFSARLVNGTTVHFTWESTVTDVDINGWEVFGNGTNGGPDNGGFGDPDNNWSYTPDYWLPGSFAFSPGPYTGALRSHDVPAADFSGATPLVVTYYLVRGPSSPGGGAGGGQVFSCTIDFALDGELHACGSLAPDARYCPASCTGSGGGGSGDVTTSSVTFGSPGWTMLPYFIILLVAFVLIVIGTRIGPGFALIGSTVIILVTLAAFTSDANATPILKSFLAIASFASLLATIVMKRNARFG